MLELRSVSKKYSRHPALDNITVSYKSGQIVGLIGPNGAGKTTLLRIISTILQPTSGQVLYQGADIQADEVRYREKIGYMPEDGGLYLKLSPRQNLMFYRTFYQQAISDSELYNYLQEFRLLDAQDKETGELSRGNRQKILFLKALINNPGLLILDEPLNSLDPEIRIKVKTKLKNFCASGKLVLLSSHTLLEIEDLCQVVTVINKGRLLISETLAGISKKYSTRPSQSLEDIYLNIIAEDEKFTNISLAGMAGT